MSTDTLETFKLGDVLDFYNGKSIKPGGHGQYPVYGSSGLIGRSNEYRYCNGLIIGRVGAYCGSVAICRGLFWASDNTIVAQPKDDRFNIKYVYYMLIDADLHRYAGGSAQPLLTQTSLCQVKVTIHTLESQRKIATILSAYDDLIENNLRRIEILEEMAQTIYREWFRNFRLPGHENVRMVDSPLGKIPEGWEVMGILETPYFEFIQENIRPYKDTKIYYATADVSGIDITGEGVEYSFEDKPSRAQKQPMTNSVWFARMQETYKVLPFTNANADVAQKCMLSSGFAGFRSCDEETFAFLFFTVNSVDFHKRKDLFCTGATQRSLTNEGLGRIQMVIPSQDMVSKFGDVVQSHIDQILMLQKQNKVLRRTRDLLLPKLISGELNVGELDIDTEGLGYG